jgi:hypothetical protein
MIQTLFLKTRYDDPLPPKERDYKTYQANDNDGPSEQPEALHGAP